MKSVICLIVLLSFVTYAHAMILMDYGWEDDGTVLDVYPDPELPSIIVTNVPASWEENPVHEGGYSLRMEYNEDNTSDAGVMVAYLWSLQDYDYFTICFWRYDTTPGIPPSVRIWAHWNDHLPDDPYANDGNAGGNIDWGDNQGWDHTCGDWEVHSGHTGLVIKAQMQGAPGDVIWLDRLTIEIEYWQEDPRIYIQVPGGDPIMFEMVSNEQQTWSSMKLLYR